MSDWSVEEQHILLEGLVGTITAINLRVDPGRSHIMIMELHTDGVGGGQLLTFNRNGGFIESTTLQPPPQNEDEAKVEAAADDDEDEDDAPPVHRSGAKAPARGRHR